MNSEMIILLFLCAIITFFFFYLQKKYSLVKKISLFCLLLFLLSVFFGKLYFSKREYSVFKKEYMVPALNELQIAMFDWIVPLAKKVQRDSGVLPSLTIAQKITEQGWDWQDDIIEREHHNYFGMKTGSDWTGAAYVTSTGEVYNGQHVTITDAFRSYASDEEGFQDRGKFLWYPRYSQVIQDCLSHDAHAAAYSLKAAGYATDPVYSQTLIKFIDMYDLTQYDNDPNYQWDGTPPGDYNFGSGVSSGTTLKKPKIDILDLTTTYKGDYKKGYLYSRFSKTLLAIHLKNEKKLDKQEDYIIKEIFKDAIDFEWATIQSAGGASTIGNGCGTSAPVLEPEFYITSSFGPRNDPFGTGTIKGHGAIDLAAPGCGGKEIHSVSNGKVITAVGGCTVGNSGCGEGYGNYVQIGYDTNGDGTDDYEVYYAHMQSTPLVATGDIVSTGQVIGHVGTTGSSTGEHLHFEIRKDGAKIDPEGIYQDLRAKKDTIFGSATACPNEEQNKDKDKDKDKNKTEKKDNT